MATRHKKKKNRAPINFDEFKVDQPEEEELEEEDEPKEESDCCDKCLFSLFGFILIYVAMFVLLFSERDHKYSQQDLSFIQYNLKSIDVNKGKLKPSEMNDLIEEITENQYPFHFVDKISNLNEKNMIVMDDRTDISYPGLALKINTEMYQWIEKEETIRKEGSTQTETQYSYQRGWSNMFHDSSNFKEQDSHYNPQPTVSKLSVRTVWVDDIIIGQNENLQFHLAKSLYTQLSKRNLWKNVTQKVFEYSELETWEMRHGYCFRPYDKAESYYSEPEPEEEEEEETQQTTTDTDTETETQENDGESESESDENGEDEENDDVLKSDDEPKERVRLDTPRTMIGDIRMTIFSLDMRGETISYLGGLKKESLDDEFNKLIPWKSATNHKFVMLEYGAMDSNEAIQQFESENVWKLWLSRLLTLIMMFLGFMIQQNILNTLVETLKLPITQKPLQTWLMTIIAAFMVSVILWITVLLIAYIVGIIYIALTLIFAIVIGIFLSNKSPKVDETDLDKKQN